MRAYRTEPRTPGTGTREGVIRRVSARVSGALIVAVLIAAGALIATALAPASDSPEGEYVIGQFNMAGGTTEFGTKHNEVPDDLVSAVNDRRPALLTLQETCRDWNERLRKQLPDYTVVFGPVDNLAKDPGSPARCAHPTDFGNTIVFRNDLGFEKSTARSHLLGSEVGDEYREMICVRSERRKLAACSAHLTPSDGPYLASRRGEAAEAARILKTRYAGYTVVLGGDVNDLPGSGVLDSFYHRDYGQGARGAFKEAGSPCGDRIRREHRESGLPRDRYEDCRSGEQTHGKGKIDYLFVSPPVRVKWGNVSFSEQSDHKQLWARVVL